MRYILKRFLPLFWIILIGMTLIYFALPGSPDLRLGKWQRELRLHKGLDLVGGSHLVYQLDTRNYQGDKEEALSQVLEIIRLRVDALGVSEPVIQRSTVENEPAIIVELPGVDDTAQARDIIGQTAQLTFFDPNSQTILTGADVERADVVFQESTNEPQVQLKLKPKGAEAFAKATRENIGQPIYIALDNDLISAPTVQEEIPNGIAVITGVGRGMNRVEAAQSARQLARQINSGALPVPVNLVEEQTVGASLGSNIVRQTIAAGLVAFTAITVFLLMVFGWAGLVSTMALILYGAAMIFFIQYIPITLTLAGVAGIVLSFGSAVDANILAFSRLREELRQQSDAYLAVKLAFEHSWTSIRDSNLASVIISFVLLWFGTGPIRGFALILLLGVIIAVGTAWGVSRQLLLFMARTKIGKKLIRL